MTPEQTHHHTPADDAERRLAPGELRTVQELINTLDLESGEDAIADPGALAAWLADHGLAAPGARFTAADLRRVQAVREGLRHVALGHNGGEPDPSRLAALAQEAARAPLEVHFTTTPSLVPARDGVAGAVGTLLAAVARAEADGTWRRFKACAAEDCHWAFYDHSRNRSRAWCSMEVCGNRAKARAYRERRGG